MGAETFLKSLSEQNPMRYTGNEASECMHFCWFYFLDGGFTSARASIWRHGVSILRTSTLVTARNVHTLIGTQMADALGTFVNVWVTRRT